MLGIGATDGAGPNVGAGMNAGVLMGWEDFYDLSRIYG